MTSLQDSSWRFTKKDTNPSIFDRLSPSMESVGHNVAYLRDPDAAFNLNYAGRNILSRASFKLPDTLNFLIDWPCTTYILGICARATLDQVMRQAPFSRALR